MIYECDSNSTQNVMIKLDNSIGYCDRIGFDKIINWLYPNKPNDVRKDFSTTYFIEQFS